MRTTVVSSLALTALLAGSLATATPTSAASTPRITAAQHDLYLNFDGGTAAKPNLSNSGGASVSTRVSSAGGGTVVGVGRENHGSSARLEPFDPDAPAPLAVVVVRPGGGDPFAPREASFTFGAAFRLDARSQGSSVDNGNNLVQRGLYNDDAQYKLEIDNQRLTCRVSGSTGAVQVSAGVTLTSGRWHRARCTREGSSVTLVLVEHTAAGAVRHRWTRSGAIGSLVFSSSPPLSVGGKVNRSGDVIVNRSDQFNGEVDNVFFRRLGG